MSVKLPSGMFVFAAALHLSACRTAPIQNIDNVPVQINKPHYTLEDVEKAIMQAGTCERWCKQVEYSIIRAGDCNRWLMYKEKPGLIQATLDADNYTAKVNISYSAMQYSIRYRDSRNLDYKAGRIHENYNEWVEDLDRRIRQELLAE